MKSKSFGNDLFSFKDSTTTSAKGVRSRSRVVQPFASPNTAHGSFVHRFDDGGVKGLLALVLGQDPQL